MTAPLRFACSSVVTPAVSLTLALLLTLAVVPAQAQPSFSKVFSPDTIGPGSVSTLTFTIDNFGGGPVTDLAFTDVLPAGVTLASPFGEHNCDDGVVTVVPGDTINFMDGEVGPGDSCTVSVNVTSGFAGVYTNTSGDLTSSAGNSGMATDDLIVVTTLPGFSKSLAPSAISFGGRSTLTFLIDNTLNPGSVDNVDFTDNLPVGMVVADPPNASTTCGSAVLPATLTAAAGSSTVTLDANGNFIFPALAAGATCSATVDVTATGIGMLDNVSNDLLANFVAAGKASDVLDVTITPLALVKSFTDDPVAPGDMVTLEFTIQNLSPSDSASAVTFTDDLALVLPGVPDLTAIGLPLVDPCGAGSTLSGSAGDTLLTLTNGSIPARDVCTFSVTLQVPATAVAGAYPNTTSAVSGTVGGGPVVGNMASDTLFVDPAPVLTKSFTNDPIGAGGTVTLEFTITNSSPGLMATDIAFTDELTTFLPFPLSVVLPVAPCGGTMGFIFPDVDRQALSLTGGTLAGGASCTFSVDINLPTDLPAGNYLNVTSDVTALVGGVPSTGRPAMDTLTVVAAPRLAKEFTDDPVMPGDTVMLEFTLTNLDTVNSVDMIGFTDDLNATLTGLSAIGLPANNVCNGTGTLSGTTSLTFSGGTLAPDSSCTFSVTLQVPGGAIPGIYSNTTSNVTATIAGVAATRSPATDDLVVTNVSFTKEFIDDPLIPGSNGILRFTIDNQGPTDATGMLFFDTLSAVLPGLAAVGPLPTTPCGAGSTISGTTSLTFLNGNLLAGTSCTFDVTVAVPGATLDGTYGNLTSNLFATLGGTSVSLPPANDTLTVTSTLLQLTKAFIGDPVAPGDMVTLEFTLTNVDPADPADMLAFTDDLNAALTGLAAVGLPANNVCNGTGSITGTTNLTFSGGTLAAGASCTFSVTVQVPGGAAAGTYTNTTSAITGEITGLPVNGTPASDDLAVSVVSLSKAFDGPTVPGGTAVLTFTIDNLGGIAANDLEFLDDLNAVIPGLSAIGLPLVDPCGAGSQVSGTSLINFGGGSLGAGGMCTFDVTVQVPAGATPGSYLNTTTNLFEAGLSVADPATAMLAIEPPPLFSKLFAPDLVVVDAPSTLTFTIDNTGSAIAATGLDFTDNLPLGSVVATPASTSTTCGGTVTAVAGSASINFTGGTVAAAASCTVSVNVTSSTPGSYLNVTGDLTSTSGNSGTASDTLEVISPLVLTKVFIPATGQPGQTLQLEYTLDNPSPLALSNIAFTDDLDAVLTGLAATGLPLTDVCGFGSLITGTGLLTFTGGSLGAGASCTFSVNVVIPADAASGNYPSTTSDPTADAGVAPVVGAAGTANLIVRADVLEIPTLDEWALLLLSSLLALLAVARMRH